jgi:hypothetical protein
MNTMERTQQMHLSRRKEKSAHAEDGDEIVHGAMEEQGEIGSAAWRL